VVSSSPELFLRLSGPHIQTRPIKGTARSPDLTRDAPHVRMQLSEARKRWPIGNDYDLLRNTGKICDSVGPGAGVGAAGALSEVQHWSRRAALNMPVRFSRRKSSGDEEHLELAQSSMRKTAREIPRSAAEKAPNRTEAKGTSSRWERFTWYMSRRGCKPAPARRGRRNQPASRVVCRDGPCCAVSLRISPRLETGSRFSLSLGRGLGEGDRDFRQSAGPWREA